MQQFGFPDEPTSEEKLNSAQADLDEKKAYLEYINRGLVNIDNLLHELERQYKLIVNSGLSDEHFSEARMVCVRIAVERFSAESRRLEAQFLVRKTKLDIEAIEEYIAGLPKDKVEH